MTDLSTLAGVAQWARDKIGKRIHPLNQVRTVADEDFEQLAATCEAAQQREAALEMKYRKALWLTHRHPFHQRYGDDGEMQCGICDFKRAPLDRLEQHVEDAMLESMREEPVNG